MEETFLIRRQLSSYFNSLKIVLNLVSDIIIASHSHPIVPEICPLLHKTLNKIRI